MFYKIVDRRIVTSSNENIDWSYIELDLSQEPHLCSWCLIDVVDWVHTLTHNAECDKIMIDEKLTRMNEIRTEIIQLWGIAQIPTDTALDLATATRITTLTAEFNALKVEVATYSPTLIDDVLLSFFG